MKPSNKVRGLGLLLVLSVFFVSMAQPTSAMTLQIPGTFAKAGETLTLSIKLDAVENLAGIKLVMGYNADILTYKNAKKTEITASLMHVINDRVPGKLIIVMAGARGIKGTDVTLMTLTFEVKKSSKKQDPAKTAVTISDVQLMTDKLEELSCDIEIEPVLIKP